MPDIKIPPWAPWVAGLGALAGAYWLWRRTGTIYTIVFENKNASSVIGNSAAPTFTALANQYGNATNYTSLLHPSLPNYIEMTSGDPHGITDDVGFVISGTDNVAYQLDQAGVPWRAYGESAPSPCFVGDTNLYAQRHMPFMYYDYVRNNPTPGYCAQHVVPMDQLAADLQSNAYRYMWITPNMCDNAHDCPITTADAWLGATVSAIQTSAGYQNNGVIFILFDENEGGQATIPAVVISPKLWNPGTPDATAYDHRSYLAAVQDLLGLPRLPGTVGVNSMAAMLR